MMSRSERKRGTGYMGQSFSFASLTHSEEILQDDRTSNSTKLLKVPGGDDCRPYQPCMAASLEAMCGQASFEVFCKNL